MANKSNINCHISVLGKNYSKLGRIMASLKQNHKTIKLTKSSKSLRLFKLK